MTYTDVEDVKAVLAELHRREAATRPRQHGDGHGTLRPDGMTADVRSLLDDGTGIGRLGTILERRRDERSNAVRDRQAGEAAESATCHAARAAALADTVAARRDALKLLEQPFTSTYQALDEPFLIWQLPHPDLSVLQDSHVEPLGSWVKVLVNTNAGPGDTDFRFYFLWSNPSDYYALVNVSSSLFFNGLAVGFGSPGMLSGNFAGLNVAAYLSVVRWSGWGSDPATGDSLDQTPYPLFDYAAANKVVVGFEAYGGDWFHDADPQSKVFDPLMPYAVEGRLVPIPGRAVTLFEVGFRVQYWFHNGNETVDEIGQNVILELANDALGHMVRCPMVQLEVLTPPAAATIPS